MKIIPAAAAIAAILSGPALAGLTTEQMNRGSGLATIIAAEEACGIEIDQAKLEAYFASVNLNNPEALTWIENMRSSAGYRPAPSASQCTMIAETARNIGILGD